MRQVSVCSNQSAIAQRYETIAQFCEQHRRTLCILYEVSHVCLRRQGREHANGATVAYAIVSNSQQRFHHGIIGAPKDLGPHV